MYCHSVSVILALDLLAYAAIQERADVKKYAWPAEQLKNSQVPAPDFSSAKPIVDEDFSNPEKRLIGKERTTDAFDSNVRGDRYVIRYKRDRSMAFSTVPVANMNRPFAFQVTARATGELSDGWGVAILTRQSPQRAVNLKISRDGTMRFDGWFKRMTDFPGQRPAPFGHKAINSGDADNTLLVLFQGEYLEVYVNGFAVCNPVPLDPGMLPATLLIVARPDHEGSTAEFKRVRLWSAHDVPPLDKRGAVVE